jgi:radical SAM superfamily enzyme YgiQ (UPF0313 family)
MTADKSSSQAYAGFEQGPIRPPSEAGSLLIRVTRNCPWNHCTFCPVYKKARFSLRPAEHVRRDIDAVHRHVERLREAADADGRLDRARVRRISAAVPSREVAAFQAALHWHANGLRSIFLQDANSLIVPPGEMIDILRRLQERFPDVERITSYARSHTIARISDENLRQMREAGLNRIHIGMESGSDRVLARVRKGADKATQIRAGRKVKAAGMSLSEYVMPGLGGRDLSEEHARETADALNRIDPDFIRLRTLALPGRVPLAREYREGRFEKPTDRETVAEIRRFIASLSGIGSRIVSDHVLNLFQEVEGRLPEDRDRMLSILDEFLEMDPERQCVYQVGRRLGFLSRLSDMESEHRTRRVRRVMDENGITPENVDGVVEELMKRFI